ncbi:PREDICTED: F-box protein DOR-like [Brassica oleracea var. oleracea]|uniref:F-box domain-containing protein n=1 Tax=Brassica oleracea var. oleracea TaxID=109376 RepID=A0A0D3EHK0_BRAOL|nr:PREDICTED: F-box protein DOR-like [Brassica oleracea var. oleracea]
MRTRRQKILEDRQAVVERLIAGETSLQIPDDLIFEILLRLPAKCIARGRCLSKLWASILDRQEFTDHYLKRSSARPQLLFAFQDRCKVFFFSAPQDDNSSLITASYHMSFPVNRVKEIYSPISGLVCVKDERILKGMKTPVTVWVICNPSTGQYFTLPRMKTRNNKCDVRSFFGYDPVEKQFKVLSMTTLAHGKRDLAIYKEHQVLTLQTGKLSWRMIECDVPHHHGINSICINGVLYYKAKNGADSSTYGKDIIVTFDVRSEKFGFIEVDKPFIPVHTLINFNGKLASLESYSFNRRSPIHLWVLDDIEKNEWSKHVYKLPASWEDVVGDADLYCVKVTASNEVVLSGYYQRSPFYVFYYSLEKETVRRVEIQGMEAFKHFQVYTFVDHVEDVKRMKGVLGLALK